MLYLSVTMRSLILPMCDDSAFTPLTKKLVISIRMPEHASMLLNPLFGDGLTLSGLMRMCIACNQKPTAPMLALAVQNSLPSLTGLPMDNPDPGFYLDIAKRFFDPQPVAFNQKVYFYRSVHNYENTDDFFPRGTNLDGSRSEYWPCTMDYYVERTMIGIPHEMITTQKGRAFAKEAMLEWRTVHEQQPDHTRFIDHIIRILDHGMVLRRRHVMPGWLRDCGHMPYRDDEHL